MVNKNTEIEISKNKHTLRNWLSVYNSLKFIVFLCPEIAFPQNHVNMINIKPNISMHICIKLIVY